MMANTSCLFDYFDNYWCVLPIETDHFSAKTAADMSTLFDFGGIAGKEMSGPIEGNFCY